MAMAPFAPGRFRITTEAFRISPTLCPTIRATTSLPPPAVNPTTILIGRLGYSEIASAEASDDVNPNMNAAAAATPHDHPNTPRMRKPSHGPTMRTSEPEPPRPAQWLDRRHSTVNSSPQSNA